MKELKRNPSAGQAIGILAGVALAGVGGWFWWKSRQGEVTPPPPPPAGMANLSGLVTEAGTNVALVGETVTLGTLSATTSATGQYTFANVTPGTYILGCTVANYAPKTQSVTLVANQSAVIPLVLDKLGPPPPVLGNVGGTVTSVTTRATLPGAVVSIYNKSAVTGNDGKYRITGLPVNSYYDVTVTLAGYQDRSTSVLVNGSEITFLIQLTPDAPAEASLGGRVTDRDTGSPLEGVNVRFGTTATFTDPNGNYFIQYTAEGSYHIEFWLNGYTTETATIPLLAGHNTYDKTMKSTYVPPPPNRTVSGRVTNRDTGAGIAGVAISGSLGTTVTDAGGYYGFASTQGLTAVSFTYSKQGFETNTAANVPVTGNLTINVQLTPITIPPPPVGLKLDLGSISIDGLGGQSFSAVGVDADGFKSAELANPLTVGGLTGVLLNWTDKTLIHFPDYPGQNGVSGVIFHMKHFPQGTTPGYRGESIVPYGGLPVQFTTSIAGIWAYGSWGPGVYGLEIIASIVESERDTGIVYNWQTIATFRIHNALNCTGFGQIP